MRIHDNPYKDNASAKSHFSIKTLLNLNQVFPLNREAVTYQNKDEVS